MRPARRRSICKRWRRAQIELRRSEGIGGRGDRGPFRRGRTSPARSGAPGRSAIFGQEGAARKSPRAALAVGSWYSARSTGAWCARASCAAARHSRCATTGDSRARLTGSPSSSGSSRSSRCTWCGRSARITRVHLARPSTACASAGWRASSRPACTSSTAATRATTLGEGTRRDSENENNAHRQNASTFDHFVGFLRFAPARDKLSTRDTVPAILRLRLDSPRKAMPCKGSRSGTSRYRSQHAQGAAPGRAREERASTDGKLTELSSAGRTNSFPRASFRLVAQALAQLEVQNAYEQAEADDIRQDDHDVAFQKTVENP
jgi:hypothetical protein